MIQRIQSVYLLLVAILLVVAIFLPVGSFVGIDGEVLNFRNYGVFSQQVADASTWGLVAILSLSAMIAVATIFLFRNRILQIRMTVFNTILLLGYYVAFIVFMVIIQKRYDAGFHLSWGLCLPLIAIILNYLAIRAIGKDEVLVKAADRLR